MSVAVSESPIDRAASPVLSWSHLDFEERLGMRGGRFTHVNGFLAFLLAVLATAVSYGVMFAFREFWLVRVFTDRGPVQYVTVLFTYWAMMVLAIKVHKRRLQQRALGVRVIPDDPHFVLSAATAQDILTRIGQVCDQPRQFILFNRMELALSNLRNIGQVGDLADLFQSQADNDEDTVESSFGLLRGLVWAVPVLGFIGTVEGLSEAVGRFANVLADAADISVIKPALQGVTAGLSTAFQTTMVSLVAALAIQLTITLVRRGEEAFLDECKEFCQRQLVGRLRVASMPRER